MTHCFLSPHLPKALSEDLTKRKELRVTVPARACVHVNDLRWQMCVRLPACAYASSVHSHACVHTCVHQSERARERERERERQQQLEQTPGPRQADGLASSPLGGMSHRLICILYD